MPPHRDTIVLDDGHGAANRVLRHRGGTAPPPDACAAAGVPLGGYDRRILRRLRQCPPG